MEKNKKIITYCTVAICFILIVIYCLSPLHVGINSGGLNKSVEQSVGLIGVDTGGFYINYNIDKNSPVVYKNGTYGFIVRNIVKLVGLISNSFDIRILSFLLGILLIVGIYFINKYIDLKTNYGNIILGILSAVVFCDLSYLVYLNTLYAEGAFYAFFIFAMGIYIKLIQDTKSNIVSILLFFISAAVICGLKENFGVLSIPFLCMGIYLFVNNGNILRRITVFVMSLILIAIPFVSCNTYSGTEENLFNSTFYGYLYESANPKEDILKLGLNEELTKYAGKTSMDIETDKITGDFYNNISYGKIFKNYLNPFTYLKQYKYVGYNAFETYPKYAGNFVYDGTRDVNELAKGFLIFNFIKSKVYPKVLWFIYGLPVLLIALIVIYKKFIPQGLRIMGYFLSLMSIIIFNIPFVSSGLVDISRTMAVFNIVFDAVFVFVVMLIIYSTYSRRNEFKEKYGISQ